MKNFYRFIVVGILLWASLASAQYSSNQVRAQATTAAIAVQSDNQLRYIQAVPPFVNPGQCYIWTFVYYSNTTQNVTIVQAGLMTQTSTQPGAQYEVFGNIPATIVDSPVIYNNSLTRGGTAFLNSHSGAQVTMFAASDTATHQTVWEVMYQGGTDIVYMLYDAVTGNHIQTVEAPEAVAANPHDFALSQNFPNPFNGGTQIRFSVAKSQPVELSLYNVTGQLVKSLYSGVATSGEHAVALSMNGLPSGEYVYRLTANGTTVSRKLNYVK